MPAGTVLKRFDASKLFTLACQDMVERFHLLLILAFVLAEEMGSSGHRLPNRQLLVQVGCRCRELGPEADVLPLRHGGRILKTVGPHCHFCWVQCGTIFMAEVVIDVVKHAVLGQQNGIRWVGRARGWWGGDGLATGPLEGWLS